MTDDFLALAQAIGYILANWALTERQLEYCCNRAYRDYTGSHFRRPKRIPLTFDPKKAFLQQCFNTIPLFSPLRAEGLKLLDRAEGLAEIRNSVVHGTIGSLEAVNGIYTFSRLLPHDDDHSVQEYDFVIADFPSHARLFGELATDWIDFSDRFLDAFPRLT